MQKITVLGATGSIGVSTLNVLALHPEKYSVFALTAHSKWQQLAEQCLKFQPVFAVMVDAASAELLRERLAQQHCKTEVLAGEPALSEVSEATEVDCVMAAIVGAAGLLPTFAAVRAGKKVLLANKEVLVMAGGLFVAEAVRSGACVLPIDSEHNAIFQCLPLAQGLTFGCDLQSLGVQSLVLTASGGPFLRATQSQLNAVTPMQACAHPNWNMGRKISVDSATMMNKGLEFIEACWLFNAKPAQIEVLIHPQSVIHSMVQYIDGSVLAQLGNPDMRTPIAQALAWPERIDAGVPSLNMAAIAQLDFETPDPVRFPCLELARQAVSVGRTAPAVLNAANEEAVNAFLSERLPFTAISAVIESTLARVNLKEPDSLDAVQIADLDARGAAQEFITQYA